MTLSIARADEPLMALGVAGVNHNLSADDYGKRVFSCPVREIFGAGA